MFNLLSPLAARHTVRTNGDDAGGPVLGDVVGHVLQVGAQQVLVVCGGSHANEYICVVSNNYNTNTWLDTVVSPSLNNKIRFLF